MHIAYSNAYYRINMSGGGNVHVGQFIDNAIALGHMIWSWKGNEHPAVRILPASPMSQWRVLRSMDVLYTRIERIPPSTTRWALAPYRQIYGFPLVVWEFNSIPEFGLLRGQTEAEVQQSIEAFRYYGKGCDLAICMTKKLAGYVQEKLGIKRVLIVPNGSDPDLFRPDVLPLRRVSNLQDWFNVVWLGSAELAWHDFDVLRRAAILLWEKNRDARILFHVIGSGFYSQMGEMPPNVNYYGGEEYELLPRWLVAGDVGLCLYHPGPADYASPLKLFDYMASGLAVVSTDQPFIRDLFCRLGQPDLIVPSHDPDGLARILLSLAADCERTRRLGQAGRQLVIDYYNWRRAVVDTFKEIQILLDERR